MVNDIAMSSDNWTTTRAGTEAASQALPGGKIWLRIAADIAPGKTGQARFSYSMDGTLFTAIGPAFSMNEAWQFFMGYRFAIFNYATQALGGSVQVSSFRLD